MSKQIVKLIVLLGVAWLAGYCGLSPAWGLLIVFSLLIQWIRNKQAGDRPCHPETGEKLRLSAQSQWVHFPDVERSDFVNKLSQKFWPFCTEYLTKTIFNDNIERMVKATNPLLNDFRFVHVDLGDMAPQIGGLKAYVQGTEYDEFVFDTEILYCGDAEVKFSIKKMTAGIKNIQLRGDARIMMKPLLKDFPFIGNIAFYFLRCPYVDFEFTNVASIVDVPGLKDAIMQVVYDIIRGMAVIPNKFIVPVLPNAKTSDMLKPNSKGVVIINIVGARNLMKLDFGLIGKTKSDPYVNVYAGGARIYRTSVKSNTTHPEWNEKAELIITENENDTLLFEVRDEDPGEDDYLGSCQVLLEDLIRKGSIEEWFTLENATTGDLCLELYWLRAVQNRASFQPTSSKGEEKLPRALLTVFVEAATNLPRVKKKGSNFTDPNPYCTFRVENQTGRSRVFLNCTNPHFSHVGQFLLKHPDSNQIIVGVEDQKTDSLIGSVRIPLRTILMANNMELEKSFHLTTALQHQATNPTIHIHLSMKILVAPRATKSVARGKQTNSQNEKCPAESTASSAPIQHSESFPNIIRNIPSVTLSVRYNLQRETLVVKIIGASNLKEQHADRAPDSYAKLSLVPHSKERFKTRVVRRDKNPEYNETFEWSMDPDLLRAQCLQVTIKSPGSIFSAEKSQTFGQAKISLSNLEIKSTSIGSYALKESSAELASLEYYNVAFASPAQ